MQCIFTFLTMSDSTTEMFQPFIRHLIVITTPSEVIVVGLRTTEHGHPSGLELIARPLFAVSSGLVHFNCISGLNGRILLAGKDGHVYELAYAKSFLGGSLFGGLFSPTCQLDCLTNSVTDHVPVVRSLFNYLLAKLPCTAILQMLVDQSRSLLWTRSDSHILRAFRVTRDAFTHLASIDLADALSCTSFAAKEIVAMTPIDSQESATLAIVLYTSTGMPYTYLCASMI